MTNECEPDALEIASKLRSYRRRSGTSAPWEEVLATMESAAYLLQSQYAMKLQAEQADRRAGELQTLIRRMEQTMRVRAERKLRAAQAEHVHDLSLREEGSISAEVQLASHRARGARVAVMPAELLRVGAITQREQDLIELAIAYTLDLPDLKAWAEAFTMSCQQPNPPAGGE